jgi:uncharacterized protein YqjF (DUF2071 family)
VTSPTTPFLTAKWLHLAMLNYAIDPAVLQPLVPVGTALDEWQGQTFVSMVGFLWADTRVMGVPIPFHRTFEEVNLRFYVRRQGPDGWRRGVVFIKELVPRWAVACVARTVYGEHFAAVQMRHTVDAAPDPASGTRTVSYGWRFGQADHELSIRVSGTPQVPAEGTAARFITDHTWGYTTRRRGGTTEYAVEHPTWQVSEANEARLDCDVERVYGSQYVEALQDPASTFLAEGSPIRILRGRRLA